MRQTVIEAELEAAPDDLALRQRDERRVHAKSGAFDTCTRGKCGERLEGMDEFRPAIGIPGVVERVDADDDVSRLEHFGPAKREREEDGVASRHIRDWNVRRRKITVARDRYVRGQRGSADAAEIKVELEMSRHAERGRDAACRLGFVLVALTVTDRQGVKLVTLRPRDGPGGITNRGRRSTGVLLASGNWVVW